jgi:hypothetical protein
MEPTLRYRGRVYTKREVDSIRDLIAANPTASRWALSRRLCALWGWVQPNGVPRDMVCRGLLLALHRGGLIDLPPARQVVRNYVVVRSKPDPVTVDTTPLEVSLAEIQPLEFRQVRRTPEERLFNSLIEEHHYLHYVRPVGEHLKYVIYGSGRPVACMAWSSAPRHLGPRDRFIGWSPECRRRNIRFLAYNTRYLVVPWVHVRCLASHILGRMAKILPRDWERIYGHPVYYLETFVNPQRHSGTCYRAANWIVLGRTTGRGNNAPTKKPTVPVKEILGYPLTKRFRELLGRVG